MISIPNLLRKLISHTIKPQNSICLKPHSNLNPKSKIAGPVSAILNVMNFQKSSFTIKYNGILKKSKNKISVWVSINGRTTGVSTIPLINSEVTIGEKKNKTCINCNCLEQNATPLCEEGNSFHIFSYPTLNSLENYLITENKGNVNELDIKLAFVDSEGNWDSDYGKNYSLNF
ncbi:hypothetical protein HDU92_005781 [Lobulomyces angularis]|nr:hypothetical protein HDU92_005781 [Lobulomyces angularis]